MISKSMLCLVAGVAVGIYASLAGAAGLSQEPNTWVKRSPLPGGPPCPRLGYEGACVWDSSHKLFIRYGGHNQGGGGAQYSEVWTFNPLTSKWTLKEPDISPPGVCCAQQNVYDPVHRRYVRFPSFSGSHGWQWFREIYLNDSTVWVYDLAKNTWRNLRPVPAPKVSPLRCASWNSDAQVIVLFGGEGNREGTVVYDPHSNVWTRMKPAAEPPFRSAGNMVYDEAHKLHVLFGSQFTDDPHVWGYCLGNNQWRDLSPPTLPPTKENDAVLCYDSVHKVVVAVVKLTEGEGEQAEHRLQTWVYNTGTNSWTRMNPQREPDTTGNRSRVLVFAPGLGLSILENRTRSKPGPPEQQIWTYRYGQTHSDTRSLLQPPRDLKVTTTPDSAILKWIPGPSEELVHYVICRGTGKYPWTVDYREIASVDADQRSYHDTNLKPGVIYYYYVCAATGGILSEPSVKVRTQPPIVEQAVVSVLSANKVHITWTPPAVDEVVGYHVERADVEVWTEDQLRRLSSRVQPLADPVIGAIRKIGSFRTLTPKPLDTPAFSDNVDLTKPHLVKGTPVLQSPLSDEHLAPDGKSYRFAVFAYRIRTVNAIGVLGGPSPCFLSIPSAPRWVFAREDRETCDLKWAPNPEKSILGYRIYRLDGRWEKDPISRMTSQPIGGLTFSDPTAGNASRRYHVVAVDTLGQEGLPSAPVWYNREWKRFYEPFVGQWHQ